MAKGEVKYRLVLEGKAFSDAISQAKKEVGNLANEFTSKLGPAGSILAGLGPAGVAAAAGIGIAVTAVGAVGAAIASSTAGFVKFAGTVTDLTAVSGVSAEALQKVAFAGADVGVDLAGANAVLFNMEKSLGKGAEMYSRLGLSVSELKAMKPEDAFQKIALAIGKIESPAMRAAAAQAIFKKGGQDALRMISAVEAGLIEQASTYGVFSNEAIAAGNAVGDSWDHLKGASERAWLALGAGIAQSPALQSMLEDLGKAVGRLTQWVLANGPVIAEWTSASVIAIGTMVQTSVNFLGELGQTFGLVAASLMAAASKITFGDLSKRLASEAEHMKAGWKQFGDDMFTISTRIAESVDKAWAARGAKPAIGGGGGGDVGGAGGMAKAAQAQKLEYEAIRIAQANEAKAQEEASKNEIAAAAKILDAKRQLLGLQAKVVGGIKEEVKLIQQEGLLMIEQAKLDEIKDPVQREFLRGLYQQITSQKVSNALEKDAVKYAEERAKAQELIAEGDARIAELAQQLLPTLEGELDLINRACMAELKRIEANKGLNESESDLLKKQALDLANLQEAAARAAEFREQMDGGGAALSAAGDAVGGTWGQMLTDLGGACVAIGQYNKGLIGAKKYGEAAAAAIAGISRMISQASGNADDMSRTLSAAATGLQTGAQVGGVFGAAVGGIAGWIYGLFSSPEWTTAWENASEIAGKTVSNGLAKAIWDTKIKLNIDLSEAEQLHITEILKEGGVSWAEEWNKTSRLPVEGKGLHPGLGPPQQYRLATFYKMINDESIPALDRINSLSEAFGSMQEEAAKAGGVARTVLLQTVMAARDAGLKVPEITQYVADELQKASEGVAAMVSGINLVDEASVQAQGSILAATFWARVKEEGMIAASLAMGDSINELKRKIEESGLEMSDAVKAMLAPIEAIGAVAGTEGGRALLEGIQGAQQALEGLMNAGWMTKDSFAGFGQVAQDAFKQLQAQGLDTGMSLQALAPMLGQIIDASKLYGFEIDANTAALIKQAADAGVAFPTDPMLQTVDLLKSIAEALGATIPASCQAAAAGVAGVGAAAAGAAGAVGGSAAAAAGSLNQIGDTGINVADTLSSALGESLTDIDDQALTLAETVGDDTTDAFEDLVSMADPAIDALTKDLVKMDDVLQDIQGDASAVGEILAGLGLGGMVTPTTAPATASGGVFPRPAVRLIGEAGPEAVTSLRDLYGQFARQVAEIVAARTGGGGSTVVNVYPAASQNEREIGIQLARELKRGGEFRTTFRQVRDGRA